MLSTWEYIRNIVWNQLWGVSQICILYLAGLNIREVLEEDEGGSVEKAIGRLMKDARRKQRAIEKPARVRLGIVS